MFFAFSFLIVYVLSSPPFLSFRLFSPAPKMALLAFPVGTAADCSRLSQGAGPPRTNCPASDPGAYEGVATIRLLGPRKGPLCMAQKRDPYVGPKNRKSRNLENIGKRNKKKKIQKYVI